MYEKNKTLIVKALIIASSIHNTLVNKRSKYTFIKDVYEYFKSILYKGVTLVKNNAGDIFYAAATFVVIAVMIVILGILFVGLCGVVFALLGIISVSFCGF